MNLRNSLSYLLVKFAPPVVTKHLGRSYSRLTNLARYHDWHFPHQFYIEITEHCNRRCWYCPNSTHTRHREMTSETFTASLRRLAEINWAGPVGFHMTNEPLLDKRLPGFIDQTVAALPRCLPTIVTNGDPLDVSGAEKLIQLGVTRIIVSRHPPFSSKWDERIRTIQSRWPQIVQLTQVGTTIAVHTNGLFGFEGLPWQGRCIAPTLACVITITGEVTLCCCDYFRHISLGNIREKPIREIWSHPGFARIRHRLRRGEQATEICKGCSGVI